MLALLLRASVSFHIPPLFPRQPKHPQSGRTSQRLTNRRILPYTLLSTTATYSNPRLVSTTLSSAVKPSRFTPILKKKHTARRPSLKPFADTAFVPYKTHFPRSPPYVRVYVHRKSQDLRYVIAQLQFARISTRPHRRRPPLRARCATLHQEANADILQTPSPKPTKTQERQSKRKITFIYASSVRALPEFATWGPRTKPHVLHVSELLSRRPSLLLLTIYTERNGRKTLTTVQGLPKKFDQKKILKVIKKKFGKEPRAPLGNYPPSD